jgi:acyl-CoA thioesterase
VATPEGINDLSLKMLEVKNEETKDANEDIIRTLMEAALEIEEVDVGLFKSKELWKPIGARGVFGGQVVAQSVNAALKTVPETYSVHSLHSYFVLAG